MIINHKQRGAALLTALFIMAMVATVATAMVFRQHLDIRRTQMILTLDQSYQLAQYGPLWAKSLLLKNAKDQQAEKVVDTLPQTTAFKEGRTDVRIELKDAQALFNINKLQDGLVNTLQATEGEDTEEDKATSESGKTYTKPPASTDSTNKESKEPEQETADEQKKSEFSFSPEAKLFIRLIQLAEPQIDEEHAETITKNIIDWLSPDAAQKVTNDNFYLQKVPAYQTSAQLFDSISELKLVADVTPALYEKLQPYITALPQKNTLININTAPALLLRALFPDISEYDIAALQNTIKSNGGFASVEDFFTEISGGGEQAVSEGVTQNESLLTVVSDYFLVVSVVTHDSQQLTIYSLLVRDSLSEEDVQVEEETPTTTPTMIAVEELPTDEQMTKDIITVRLLWERFATL